MKDEYGEENCVDEEQVDYEYSEVDKDEEV